MHQAECGSYQNSSVKSGFIFIQVRQPEPVRMEDKLAPFPKLPGLDCKGPVQLIVALVLFRVLAEKITVFALTPPIGLTVSTFFAITKTSIHITIRIIFLQEEIEKRKITNRHNDQDDINNFSYFHNISILKL